MDGQINKQMDRYIDIWIDSQMHEYKSCGT